MTPKELAYVRRRYGLEENITYDFSLLSPREGDMAYSIEEDIYLGMYITKIRERKFLADLIIHLFRTLIVIDPEEPPEVTNYTQEVSFNVWLFMVKTYHLHRFPEISSKTRMKQFLY